MSHEPVGIDSDILIHAYHQTKNDQDDISERARRLLDWLFDQKRPVYLSVISIGEFLVKVPIGKHARTIQKLEERFRIAPFNLKAASLAADLVSKSKNNPAIVRVDGDRPCLMADIKIVASLLATGSVRQIYGNDDRMISIVNSLSTTVATKLPVDPLTLLQYQDDPGQSLEPEDFDLDA